MTMAKQAPRNLNVMIDLETMGTMADSIILSIGAVMFDLKSDYIDNNAFYASITVESNKETGRTFSEDTLKWWLDQSPAAQQVFKEGGKVHLADALDSLTTWYADGSMPVWSNGADFDIPMLAHAFGSYGVQTPWKFWNSRCYRTMKSIFKTIPPDRQGTHHNALDDAIFQARHLQSIFKGIA